MLAYLIDNFSEKFLKILLEIIDDAIKNVSFPEELKKLDYFYEQTQKLEEFQICSKFYDVKILFISSAYQCCFESHSWRKKEVAFLLLGSFLEDLIDFYNTFTKDFDIELLVKNIVAQIQNENVEKILLARGLWCLSKFSMFLEKKNKDLLLNLCLLSVNCLMNHQQPALKLIATKSISQ